MSDSDSDVEMEEDPHKGELPYNPDQDPNEKRRVRGNYRQLQADLEAQKANLNECTAEELTKRVHQANALFRHVKAPQEATLDSHVLLQASTLGAQKARAMKSGAGAFDIDDFVSKLITFMGGRKPTEVLDDSDSDEGDADAPLDWDKIGRKALAKSRRVPVMDFMLGPLSIEHKKRAQVKRAKLEKNKAEQRKPQELQENDITRTENETTKNVLMLKELLDNTGPINLFRLVINPNDFAQSVENIFYLSFLIRDGLVVLENNPNTGEPHIFKCEPPSVEEYTEGLQKRQIVFEFDMEIWKRAIEVFNITESTIPQRTPAKD